jgi:type II secretory pathway pseudopilin PulG
MRKLGNPISLRKRPTAFTLVELIISIGMVLILMTGIVKVFKYATDAVGAGLAVSDIVRAQRALATQIPTDMQGLSSNANSCPAILLDSQQNTVPTPWPSTFTPGTANTFIQSGNNLATVQGPIFLDKTSEANYQTLGFSDVQFRQDTFSFFSKSVGSTNFARQTGNDGTFVNPMTSTWAWIWYGQLWLPDNSAAFHPNGTGDTNSTYPGCGTSATNPNNFYARQWQLGRMAMLILPKNAKFGASVNNTDIFSGFWPGTAGNKKFQSFINEFMNPVPIGSYLAPLAFNSQSRDYQDLNNQSNQVSPPKSPLWVAEQSRYDLAGVTAIGTGDPFVDYFKQRLDSTAVPPLVTPATYVPNWMVPVTGTNWSAETGYSLNYRFQANPYPVRNTSVTNQSALGSSQLAQITPTLASGCVRFYVEYAGDYLQQNSDPTKGPLGAVISNFRQAGFVADGTDFYLDTNNVRHIRWYGLPRDSNGDGKIDTVNNAQSGFVQDVLPLAYFLGTSAAPINAPWEQYPLLNSWPAVLNQYICAWDATPSGGANFTKRPTMFRITVELIDADGRLNSPRVLQYIVPVGQ